MRLRRQSRLLESSLVKAKRRERLRDEWVTYAVHEMEQALEHLSEGTDAIVDDALDLAKIDLAKTILACRQMSHPKALVTL
ncbi:MAG: hypothetical protein GWQ05_01835 [Verrucomicrobiaceae bacterium]|nr:hypothetical protein [Verrucomicrobiaceae bacterium]